MDTVIVKNKIKDRGSNLSPFSKLMKTATNSNSNTDDAIVLIANIRKKYRSTLMEKLSLFSYGDELRQKLNIISDALTYVSLGQSDKLAAYDSNNDTLLNKLKDDNVSIKFVRRLIRNDITFQNTLDVISSEFNINLGEKGNLNKLLEHPDLDQKPEIRLAMQMYLMKGYFNWVPDTESEFRKFLFNGEQSLKTNSSINCWEAVMYGMLKTDLLTKNDLKKYYSGGISDLETRLEGWFNGLPQTNITINTPNHKKWRELLKEQPYVIMINTLSHDMISIPYSQKQLLKMMLTKNFDEKPTRAKLYSHWTTWTAGSVGTVKKDEFEYRLKRPMSPVKIATLNDFVERGKNYPSNTNMEK